MAVAVLALKITSVVAKMCGSAFTGEGAFVGAGESRGVVRASGDRGMGDVMALRDERDLAQDGGLLQVAVGDTAGKIVHRG